MAYRKTEKVLAQLEGRRQLIIASAIDIITKSGIEAVTTDKVAARAGIANGSVYFNFADRAEMDAAVFAHLLARDLSAIRKVAAAQDTPVGALAAAITTFSDIAQGLLGRACEACPIYRKGIESELYSLISNWDRQRLEGAGMVDPLGKTGIKLAAKATMGAIYGLAHTHGPRDKIASTALLFVLRGIGVSDAMARRAVSRYSMETA